MIMESGSITASQTDGETVETVTDFIWGGGTKITEDVEYSHKLKHTCSLEKSYDQETLLCQQRSIWSKLLFFQ